MAREKAQYIFDTFQVQTVPATITAVDKRHQEWTRRSNAGVALARNIEARTANNLILAQRTIPQETELRLRSHQTMQHKAERTIRGMQRRYGDKQTKVVSSYASRSQLEAAGQHIVRLGGILPSEYIPLYFSTARALRESGFGQYIVKLDSDYDGYHKDHYVVMGIGRGNPEENKWGKFYDAFYPGLEAFKNARDSGAELNPAYSLAARAVQRFAGQMAMSAEA